MIENPELLQAIENVFNERFERDMEEFRSTPPHVFSEKHKKKMAKLIKRQRKPYFKLICTTGRRVACIIVAIVAIAASTLSVKAVREAIFNFITRIFSDHTVVTVESGTAEGYPETIEEEYYISDLPEGFELVDHQITNTTITSSYFNKESYIVFTQYVKKHFKRNIDNETTLYEKIVYDNQEYLIYSSKHDSLYILDNGSYILSIQSNLDKNTILGLFKSTKIK
ncbi:MAG: DUF4367 domain-containing protein [Ruminococcus sp.]|nr:DUF4367 domain-containing protein [Ruminococcus sp.]